MEAVLFIQTRFGIIVIIQLLGIRIRDMSWPLVTLESHNSLEGGDIEELG